MPASTQLITKKLMLAILIFLTMDLGTKSIAQNAKIDSLRNLLDTGITEKE